MLSSATAGGMSSSTVSRPSGVVSDSSAATRATSSATRPARHGVQAFAAVARASASVSTSSSSSVRASPTRSTTWADGGGVLEVTGGGGLGEQQVPAHQTASRAASSAEYPIRAAIAAAIGSPATLWSTRPPLPMSCSSAATTSRSGRRDPADQPGRLDAGLDQVPVDGEPVHDRGVREQPDPLPLGQQPVEGAGLVEGLPHRRAGRDRRRGGARAGSGPPRATAPGWVGTHGPGAPRWAGPGSGRARRPPPRRGAAASGRRRAGHPGRGRPRRWTARRRRADRLQVRAAAVRAGHRAREHALRPGAR